MERIYKGATEEPFTRLPQPRRRAFRRPFLFYPTLPLTSRLLVYTQQVRRLLSSILQLQGRDWQTMGGHSKTAIVS